MRILAKLMGDGCEMLIDTSLGPFPPSRGNASWGCALFEVGVPGQIRSPGLKNLKIAAIRSSFSVASAQTDGKKQLKRCQLTHTS